MNFIRKNSKISFKMFIISVLAIFVLVCCIGKETYGLKTYTNIPKEKIKADPGFNILFDITKANKFDIKFEILERDSYTFSWLFYAFEDTKKKDNGLVASIKSLFNISNPLTLEEQADNDRILNLLDSIGEKEREISGKLQQSSIIIPVKFKIFLVEEGGEKLVWDNEMEYNRNEEIGLKQNRGGGWGEYMVHFAGLILQPGNYHIIIEILNDVPEFKGTKTGISINQDSK